MWPYCAQKQRNLGVCVFFCWQGVYGLAWGGYTEFVMRGNRTRLMMATGLCLGVFSLCAWGDAGADWRRAAVNREKAAIARQVEAQILVQQADKIRAQAEIAASDQREGLYRRAGAIRMQAAGLAGAAAGSYGQASRNWGQVARLYTSGKQAELKRDAERRSKEAKEAVVGACRYAATLYEAAALLFAPGTGADIRQEAGATELAAQWWERAAGGR